MVNIEYYRTDSISVERKCYEIRNKFFVAIFVSIFANIQTLIFVLKEPTLLMRCCWQNKINLTILGLYVFV